ncbi:MAG: peptide chain release factor N(5)-glutamine methyltransferase [Vulcanimicrobiota bacterium]
MIDCDRVNKTIGWAITMGRYLLGGAFTSTPSLDAELILGKILTMTRTQLHVHSDRVLSELEYDGYRKALEERLKGMPVSYITGMREFMSLSFRISPGCFIPRAETETLVEKAVERLWTKGISSPRILEIGTGSGCIAVSLARYLKNCTILATDISPQAAEIAEGNIKSHGVGHLATLRVGDVYDVLSAREYDSFDAIISNPPYISVDEIDELPLSVKNFEPSPALWTDEGGTLISRKIIEGAGKYLRQEGFISIEINPRALDRIIELFYASGYPATEVYRDLAGYPRVVTGERA